MGAVTKRLEQAPAHIFEDKKWMCLGNCNSQGIAKEPTLAPPKSQLHVWYVCS